MDYRLTSAYQKMLCYLTAARDYDVHTYPHPEFFGVPHDMYRVQDIFNDISYGRVSLAQLQLALEVLNFADYVLWCRSVVSGDPLHPENRTELRKYLNYCWQLLGRCDMLAKACGKSIDWVGEVTYTIFQLFGVRYP
ncbi:hypothetical protein AJ79_01518 [Helicocarpus griseus UAMH5409]|uniref:Uncharacterized protein n=1 Tax=Helicocarpus griseus UAMH5409 TaxID=1447875 RepID=A0A2B7XYJ9_9EURO|nr:hypothetical protein AJ79_01518 [Helicocarpus griseus UAMH5409]